MKTVKGELNKAKKQTQGSYSNLKKQIKLSTDKIGDYPVDYMKLTKNALKIVVPLVVLKMIHSKYKKANSNKVKDAFESLYNEVKAKLKDI